MASRMPIGSVRATTGRSAGRRTSHLLSAGGYSARRRRRRSAHVRCRRCVVGSTSRRCRRVQAGCGAGCRTAYRPESEPRSARPPPAAAGTPRRSRARRTAPRRERPGPGRPEPGAYPWSVPPPPPLPPPSSPPRPLPPPPPRPLRAPRACLPPPPRPSLSPPPSFPPPLPPLSPSSPPVVQVAGRELLVLYASWR